MMFSNTATVANNEFRTLFKEKTFLLLLIIFILMTLLSTYIGWSSKTTVEKVYIETTKKLAETGPNEIPPDPFAKIPELSIVKNMVAYVFMIGTILAIVLGNNSFIRDRRSGVSKIIFSRPIHRSEIVNGKILGIIYALASIIVTSFIISLISTVVISGKVVSISETQRLLCFYFLSFVYLLIFAIIGLFFSIYSSNQSLALMVPILIWISVNFVLPELTSALNPTASLNPTNISSAIPHNSFFLVLQNTIKPFSISEIYKEVSGYLLELNNNNLSITKTLVGYSGGLVFMFSLLGFLIFGCYWAMNKFNVCEETLNE